MKSYTTCVCIVYACLCRAKLSNNNLCTAMREAAKQFKQIFIVFDVSFY